MHALYRSGFVNMVDYTPPTTQVNAGDVVPGLSSGVAVLIAHHDIPPNTIGAIATGGGVYQVTNLDNSANFAKVYWDGTNFGVSATNTNPKFGYIVSGGGAGVGTPCYVYHDPYS